MEVVVIIEKKRYTANVSAPCDISIPVRFDGTSLSAFGAQPAHRDAYKAEGFVGDVGKGGSCNCDSLHFSPHLHGTHTECVGHIVSDTIYVCDVIREGFIPSTLITIKPQEESGDQLITRSVLEKALKAAEAGFLQGLVIRTLPNAQDKITKYYGAEMPPYFSPDAMRYINDIGVKHLLVDMPSIDRMQDEGKLASHHIFWGVDAGSRALKGKPASRKTVTELIYVPEAIKDGHYLLNLQVAPLMTDAAPSRPLLYEVKPA